MNKSVPPSSDLADTESVSSKAQAPRKRLCGTLVRREKWCLTWRGRFGAAALGCAVGAILVLSAHPFLATTRREATDVLVVEGWIHDYAIQAGAEEFSRGNYAQVYATGGPVSGLGGYLNDYSTSASIGAGRLKKAGVPEALVQMVPSKVSGRDRTYSSALALRYWFEEHNLHPKAINIVTEDMHARRTRLLFQKALGSAVKVGIIAIPNPDYDAGRWWNYSEGVREMIGESIAYIYARLFFWPSAPEQPLETAVVSRPE